MNIHCYSSDLDIRRLLYLPNSWSHNDFPNVSAHLLLDHLANCLRNLVVAVVVDLNYHLVVVMVAMVEYYLNPGEIR
jgi:hypothetical protein